MVAMRLAYAETRRFQPSHMAPGAPLRSLTSTRSAVGLAGRLKPSPPRRPSSNLSRERRIGAGQGHGLELALSPEQRLQCRKLMDSCGIRLAALGAAFRVGRDPVPQLDELADLAEALGAGHVRIFLDDQREDERHADWVGRLAMAFAEIEDLAAASPGLLIVENQGSVARCADLAKVLPEAIGLLWDVAYSLKAGESAAESMTYLPRMTHVHLKDVRQQGAGWAASRLGEGMVDIDFILGRLRDADFPGVISLETKSDDPDGDLGRLVRLSTADTAA